MKRKILTLDFDGLIFKIEEDNPVVGVYLYVFKKDVCIRDFLLETIDDCKEMALENFNVPIENWEPVPIRIKRN